MYRTHTCGALRAEHIGQEVTICGWVDRIRNQGGLVFVNLRDRYGITQTAFAPEAGEDLLEQARGLKMEYVVQVTGKVCARPVGQANPDMATGEIEVRPTQMTLLNKCNQPPVYPSIPELPSEDVRLQYRYLDLRRTAMQDALILRHRMIKTLRDYTDAHGFIEVETPMLGRSTPEGARDYLVPSRVHPGKYYALPQSPQLYKQLLMIAGYDRYVQLARCFRDEDLRADRQPEFTQLDIEMSFVEMEDILTFMDGMIADLAKKILGLDLHLPLSRMDYDEAMERYGSDKPDLRFGMEIIDLTEFAKTVDFQVFRGPAEAGNRVRAIVVPQCADKYSRKAIDELTTYVKEDFKAKGLVWFKVENGDIASPTAKKFTDEEHKKILEITGAKDGDMILVVADTFDITCAALDGLRRRLAKELKLYDPKSMSFSWIVSFPMFEWNEEENKWDAKHHPFTMPQPAELDLLDTAPEKVHAVAYDLVINGFEAGGGTVRIHDTNLQAKIFKLLNIDDQTAHERFGFLLDALKFGAPPHAGIALGVDRLVMLFGGYDNIRDVIAFPKTARAADLMTGAPGVVDDKQLDELSIQNTRKEEN
ncbi:MAG: aspartate--tRNA ligase [Thermoguttaceae bacterium]|nr:aspartate--tRNA ligase [Thermoguttaceae bacterium]